jgi:hypothetical protein
LKTAPAELSEKLALHLAFAAGELPRPLLRLFPPSGGASSRYPNCDNDLRVEDVIAKGRLRASRRIDDDFFPVARVYFGTAMLVALAGGDFSCNGATTWAHPTADSAVGLEIPPLDEDLPIWRNYAKKFRALRDAEIPGVMLGLPDLIGPLDIAAGLLGSEQLAVDMMLEPESVAAMLAKCAELWKQVFDFHVRELGSVGGGMVTMFDNFMPGCSALWSEDFSALIGPETYRNFGMALDGDLARHLDSSILHVHSAAGRCLPAIKNIENLSAVEISNDPNGPPLANILEWAAEIQKAGKSVMLSNWEHPLSDSDVDTILQTLDPSRLLVTLQCADDAQAAGYRQKFLRHEKAKN